MKKLFLLMGLWFATPAFAQKIAVWNPEQGTRQPPNRFTLDLPRLQNSVKALQNAGLGVEWLSAAQLAASKVGSV